MKNPVPQGKYVPAVRAGQLIMTAGMTSRKDGVLIYTGKVQADKPLEEYKEAVIQAAANALTAAKNQLQEGEKIGRVLQMIVYVNAAEGFVDHTKLADFASEYLTEQLGDAGVCARCALGMASLPKNAPVEISLTAVVG
ncbi:RidA family protein [Acidaminococcus sp. NSJ-142]|jgi:enamine deaminase RidA (YjgF/YER057c/UK114 family)|uniref:RidA family protein n=1 Tax=Acidaminococcus TaxID=904 RepID=UPI000CF89944|nr:MULTISPECIES: RidA family protein [Acidaminococcus]MCD2435913.1 RidA family protein [Acidaminococcus hominis]MCH4096619.1 RidA family protein [Acidaminococcus provencensis]RHK02585.1 RidA family protein [Acidaminococcus sp. AM05-11]